MRKREFNLIQACISLLIPVALLFAVIYGDRAVTTMYENAPIYRSTVIIDAGHGGVDGGAISCTGIHESLLNLQIALRLEDTLNLLGIRTIMIRREDISVYTQGETIAQKKISDLKHRVKTINSLPDSILVSIHQNHFTDSRYRGAQVFYGRTSDSDILARHLQADLISHLNNESNRKAKKSSGVYLLDHIQNTGVLIECGFLSNPEEEALLRSEAYQKKLSCVIAASLSRYLYSNSVA